MTTTDGAVPALPTPDPGLPGAGGLLGTEGRDLVAAFAERRGIEITDHRAVQAVYRPGRSMIVRHRVRGRTRTGEQRAMSVAVERRVRERDPAPAPPAFQERFGMAPVDRIGDALVWMFPYDPALPAIADAAWGPSVRPWAGPAPLVVAAEPVRYRPRSRAVFRYFAIDPRTGARHLLYGKTMRRSRARRLRNLPPGVSRGATVARPFAAVGEHTLLFRAQPGRSLRELLLEGEQLPKPERVAALVDPLPGLPLDAREPPDPLAQAQAAADVVRRLVPRSAGDANRIVEAVALGAREPVALRPVHGDLYEAQVFVDERFRLSLIDLDDAGLGDPVMEAANLSAHLVALALALPRASARLLAYRALLRPPLLEATGATDLDLVWREALAMLRLAPGPFRVLHPRWPAEVTRRVRVAVRILDGL